MKSRLVLLGPPASGKGTQAELIHRRYGFPITSPGAILREQKRLGTPLGIEADRLTRDGRLLPDAIIVQVIAEWLQQHDGEFIFDGFPRSTGQADAMEALLARRGTPVQAVLALETTLETLQSRVAGRLVCGACGHIVGLGLDVESPSSPCPKCSGTLGRRADDTPETLRTRLEEYSAKTEPLLAYYEQRGLLSRIDSGRPPQDVFASIRAVLESTPAPTFAA